MATANAINEGLEAVANWAKILPRGPSIVLVAAIQVLFTPAREILVEGLV
jgi:hypothetical protein